MASYIESTDRPNESRVAGEDIYVGEAVALPGDGTAVRFDAASHALGQFAGVADNPLTGDQIALDEDEEGGFTYEAAENDRVVFGGDADADRIKLRTAKSDGTDDPAPNVTDGDIVGFIYDSDGSLTTPDNFVGRIVEEGYSDGTTTYGRSSAGDFVAVGRAYRDEGTTDTPVRIEVRKDL